MYELLRLRYVLLTALSVSLVPAPTAAREIYKWVDERGATHYGEQLPEGAVASLEVLDVTAAEATPGAGARDYRWTLDLANRLQADRLERERLRLDRQRLRLQQLEVESGNPQPNDASGRRRTTYRSMAILAVLIHDHRITESTRGTRHCHMDTFRPVGIRYPTCQNGST